MFWAIVGHFVGDYLFQSKRVAIGKSSPGRGGIGLCVYHCLAYSGWVWAVVVLGMGWLGNDSPNDLLIVPMVFLTHYPIDRWSLADKWLALVNGRRVGLFDIKGPGDGSQFHQEAVVVTHAMQQAFAAIVYTVVDNTLHILLMLAGFAVLLHWGAI